MRACVRAGWRAPLLNAPSASDTVSFSSRATSFLQVGRAGVRMEDVRRFIGNNVDRIKRRLPKKAEAKPAPAPVEEPKPAPAPAPAPPPPAPAKKVRGRDRDQGRERERARDPREDAMFPPARWGWGFVVSC